jgi:hypothetical protein
VTESPPPATAPAAAANAALGGEHAAIYAYGVVGARLDRREQSLATSAITRHVSRRDTLTGLISAASGVPVAAEPAYRLPFPVRHRGDALRLAALVEDRLAALYVALVEATEDRALRSLGAGAVQAAAADAASWRLRAGTAPVTVAFPGR